MNRELTAVDLKWCADKCKEWWTEEVRHIIRIADEVCENIFLFDLPWDMEPTCVPCQFNEEVNWTYIHGDDPEFIYQLNRHRYWICLGQAYALTGDEKYTVCFIRQLMDWLKKNPITVETKETTWRSIEAGIRGENWTKAIRYFKESPHMTHEVIKTFYQGLMTHGEYLRNYKSPFSLKSNWGVIENAGLYAISKALESQGILNDFSNIALDNLSRALSYQVTPDGMHWEQSAMYHNEVFKCTLEVLHTAREYKEELPQIIKEAALAMANTNLSWMKPNHCQVTAGDSDETDLRDLITLSAYVFKNPYFKFCGYEHLDFESIWEYGQEAVEDYENLESIEPKSGLMVFEEQGHYFLRSGYQEKDDYLHFKTGPMGCGHGHIDKLHIDLAIKGEDILMDSGRYTYVKSKNRARFKCGLAHNTILINDKEYSQCIEPWEVAHLTQAIDQKSYQKGEYTYMQGGHLGYIKDGFYIKRSILCIGTRIYVVMDEVYGEGEFKYTEHYHFNPDGKVHTEDHKIYYRGTSGKACFWIMNEEAKILLSKEPFSSKYNQMIETTGAVVSGMSQGNTFLPAVIIGQGMEEQDEYQVQLVTPKNAMNGKDLAPNKAQALMITGTDRSYLVAIRHIENGVDYDFIEVNGKCGMGSVMVCELNTETEFTVLKW